MSVRIVLDTNVLVSAFLKPGSIPYRLLEAVWPRRIVVVFDDRLEAEYRSVLARPKFRSMDRDAVDAFFGRLEKLGERRRDVRAWSGPMRDEDDRMFVEVALDGGADALVAGNLKDYPSGLGFAVEPPATFLGRLG